MGDDGLDRVGARRGAETRVEETISVLSLLNTLCPGVRESLLTVKLES